MRRTSSGMGGAGMSLGLPPFTRAVKWIVISNVAIYFLLLLAGSLGTGIVGPVHQIFGLVPLSVTHGYLWQIVTYAFIHAGVSHVLWNMLGIWMFGGQFERDWGTTRFVEYYFFCVIAAALTTIAVGYGGLALYNSSPATPLFRSMASLVMSPTVGASGGLFGILIAFGMFYGDQEIMLFPLPFMIKAKYIVTAWILIALAGALGEGSQGTANFAHLGGAFFGWLYLKYGPKRGMQLAASESYYGVRNRYYRWKRRQAAKKFEVYMRNHKKEDFFDEYGNYKGPGADPRDQGDNNPRGPWVN